jgi:hypothetical protein
METHNNVSLISQSMFVRHEQYGAARACNHRTRIDLNHILELSKVSWRGSIAEGGDLARR